MSDALTVLTVAAALGCGLLAGVFFAFSTFMMKALARLAPEQGIAAMQSINVAVINPLFLVAFLGTGAAGAAAMVVALADWDGSYGPLVLIGGALYLVGCFGVTMSANVPRNDALERLDPTDPAAAREWQRYLIEWTRWNHVRTVSPVVAGGLEIAALLVS